MIKVDLIIEARWLIPVVPQQVILEHHALVVDGGLIKAILPIELARGQYHANKTLKLDDHVMMPGLINLHTHAAMSLMRGIADDLALMPWLQQHIWPAEKAFISESFVRDGTLLACAEMLAGGITCFNDMYFFPQAAAEASLQAGMRANLGLVVLEFPTNYANDAEDYIQKGLESRDLWRQHSLISSSFAPHAPYTVENRTFEKIITYAEQLNLGIHTHLHETQGEIQQSLEQYGIRPLQRMADLGLLGPNLIAAHGVHLNDAEIEMLNVHGCNIAHCPTSNLKLASGIAPIARLLEQQVNVGIGTDGAASNNRLDMFAELRLAALLAKGASHDAAALPAEQAIAMATINAARALGLDDKIGSLEVGKQADIIAVRIADVECTPCYDPISHLVYVAGREHVTHTWVNGELRYQKLEGQQGVYANIEPSELKEISSSWQAKLNIHKA